MIQLLSLTQRLISMKLANIKRYLKSKRSRITKQLCLTEPTVAVHRTVFVGGAQEPFVAEKICRLTRPFSCKRCVHSKTDAENERVIASVD